MKRENFSGKKDLKIKSFKIGNYHRKLLLQVNSIQNPIFFNKEDSMNYNKVRNV